MRKLKKIHFLIILCLGWGDLEAGDQRSMRPGDYDETLQVGSIHRSYRLHIPKKWDAEKKHPLVLVFHGGGGNAQSAEKMSGFSQKSDQEGFIVVYPNGTGVLRNKLLTWNSGNCCGYALDHRMDDVGFIQALLYSLQERLTVDPLSIFVTGMSNGGMMSHVLGCELSDRIAAIAPVAGALNLEVPKAKHPVSVVIFHGIDDQHVLYDGGEPKKKADRHPRVDRPVSFAVSFWVNHDHCHSTPIKEETEHYLFEKYSGGDDGTEVAVYTLKGGGHSWPGGFRGRLQADVPVQEVSATDLMWDFFKTHSKK